MVRTPLKHRTLLLSLICITTLSLGCLIYKSFNTEYKPSLKSYKDFVVEEAKLRSLIEISSACIDTTVNINQFENSKKQFFQFKDNYKYVLNSLNEKNIDLNSTESNALNNLSIKMTRSLKKYSRLAYMYNQINEENKSILITYNGLKKELGISNSTNNGEQYQFSLDNKEIEKYKRIKHLYETLKKNPNRNNIKYFSEDIHKEHIIFICANIQELITIRCFIDETRAIYVNRRNSNFVNENKTQVAKLIKQLQSIRNRSELCNLYIPRESRSLKKLERFAYSIAK